MRKCRSVAAAVVVGCVGAATANVGPIPGATPIAGTSLCVVDGWEYAPRWSTPNNGLKSPSLEDCAMQCEADAVCTGTTWIVNNDGNNCWFKDWGAGPVAPPCLPPAGKNLQFQAIIDPKGADCAAITYMDLPTLDCDVESEIEEKPEATGPAAGVEMEAAGPAAITTTDLTTLEPDFKVYPGVDYSPVQDPPPMVGIIDVGGGAGLVVADAAECAAACTAEPTCNAASYYGDNPMPWPGGDNCYLKTLTGCELPADVVMTGDATIFMIGGATCSGAPLSAPALGAAAPLAAAPPLDVIPVAAPIAPTAAAPTGTLGFDPVPGGVPPLGTDDGVGTDDAGTRSFGAPAPTTEPAGSEAGAGSSVPPVTPPAAGAVGVLPGLAAAASAVVGAFMLV